MSNIMQIPENNNVFSSAKTVATFQIPDELAKRLSDLLVTQSIRERVLANLVGKPEYDQMENKLIAIVNEIDAIKNKITMEYVPDEYRSERFTWTYEGYGISQNNISIIE